MSVNCILPPDISEPKRNNIPASDVAVCAVEMLFHRGVRGVSIIIGSHEASPRASRAVDAADIIVIKA
jgi:hypothetical protein